MASLTMHSKTLHGIELRLIGLQLEALAWENLFRRGVTTAECRSFGTQPDEIESVKIVRLEAER